MTLAKALQNLVAHICLVHASKWRSFGPIRNNSPKMVPSNPNCQLPDELLLPRLIHTFFFFPASGHCRQDRQILCRLVKLVSEGRGLKSFSKFQTCRGFFADLIPLHQTVSPRRRPHCRTPASEIGDRLNQSPNRTSASTSLGIGR